MSKPLFIYVDVDDTLVHKNEQGEEQPIAHVANHIRSLHEQGAVFYCWSTGGEEHARKIAKQLGIEECFSGFLHKPHVFIDDQKAEEWENFLHVLPDDLGTYQEYRDEVDTDE